jgi:Fe-Mn family superoxide dismutase
MSMKKEGLMARYKLPDLDYDYGALAPHISGEINELHYTKHHATYVKGANDTLDKLAEARDAGNFGDIVGLETTLAFHLAGHSNHVVWWKILSPEGGDKPTGELAAAIDEAFGSFDKFKAQFTAVSTTIQGNGWGALSWDPLGKTLITQQLRDHHNNLVLATTPILLVDVWEHAFYLDYKNVKPKYVEALWNIFNWAEISKRFDNAVAGGNGLLLS